MDTIYKNKKVILVDDSNTVRQIIRGELEAMGFAKDNVEVAVDGKQAFELITATKFDLIISDWIMPNMDGLELLKAVKSDERFKGVLFLMVTSESDKEKTKEVFESGADQYITKPFDNKTLDKTIQLLLSEAVDFGDKKVMVIDDSNTIRQIIMKNLKQAGFIEENIKESSDGEDALEKLCEERMDIIITDWNMPKMSGLEFLKRVRGKTTLNGMPVLMVTSVSEKAKILEAIKAGVSDYLIKPFNAVELQIKVKSLFQSHQTAA